jgi:hypothetical protein
MNSSNLVTERATSTLSSSVDKLLDNLNKHEELTIDLSHLGVTVLNEPVFDNAPTPYDDSVPTRYGNKVGTVTLQIRSNGIIYRIPASLSPYGVPRLPVITTQLQTQAYSLASPGEPQPDVGVTCDFDATQSTIVTWQVYQSTGWTDMNFAFLYQNGTKYSSFPGPGYHTFQPKTATWTYKNADGTSGSTTKTVGDVTFTTPNYLSDVSSQTAALTLQFVSGNTCDAITIGKIRLKIDNSAIGGGVKYSGECVCVLEDQTDSFCYITTAVCQSSNLPDDCFELETLRSFRDSFMVETSERIELLNEYYRRAPLIVSNINRREDSVQIYKNIKSLYIDKAVDLIGTGKNEEAFCLYRDMLLFIESQYGN